MSKHPICECGLRMITEWDSETLWYCVGCHVITKAVGGKQAKSIKTDHRCESSPECQPREAPRRPLITRTEE